MCYERRRAEACVGESAHHALVNAGGRELFRLFRCSDQNTWTRDPENFRLLNLKFKKV